MSAKKTRIFTTKTPDKPGAFMRACKVIMDHETGRSKCYGFVEMPNEAEAYKAIVETDDMDFQGSVLQVKKSRPQNEKSGHAKTGGSQKRNFLA